MIAIYPLAVKDSDPRGGCNILTPVIVPFYIGFVAQDFGPFFADIGDREGGANVEPHVVVEVGIPGRRAAVRALSCARRCRRGLPHLRDYSPAPLFLPYSPTSALLISSFMQPFRILYFLYLDFLYFTEI